MNHNILGKIIDKVAFKQWEIKIKKINEQYHVIFRVNEFDVLQCIDRSRNKESMKDAFNYRSKDEGEESVIYRYIYSQQNWYYVSELPENYM